MVIFASCNALPHTIAAAAEGNICTPRNVEGSLCSIKWHGIFGFVTSLIAAPIDALLNQSRGLGLIGVFITANSEGAESGAG